MVNPGSDSARIPKAIHGPESHRAAAETMATTLADLRKKKLTKAATGSKSIAMRR